MCNVPRYLIGVDLHKTVLQICVLDRTGEIVEELRCRPVDQAGGELVLDRIQPYLNDGRLAVEAIGLNRWFVNRLISRNVDFIVCDPIKLNIASTET